MTKLRCNAVHCQHNDSNYCCLPKVQIGGGQQAKNPRDTCCDSFKERSQASTNRSDMYSHPDSALSVVCSALSCKYNANGQCAAKAIQIGGATAYRSHDTKCDTFACQSSCSSCKNCK